MLVFQNCILIGFVRYFDYENDFTEFTDSCTIYQGLEQTVSRKVSDLSHLPASNRAL